MNKVILFLLAISCMVGFFPIQAEGRAGGWGCYEKYMLETNSGSTDAEIAAHVPSCSTCQDIIASRKARMIQWEKTWGNAEWRAKNDRPSPKNCLGEKVTEREITYWVLAGFIGVVAGVPFGAVLGFVVGRKQKG